LRYGSQKFPECATIVTRDGRYCAHILLVISYTEEEAVYLSDDPDTVETTYA
jgi:hypothetical protein